MEPIKILIVDNSGATRDYLTELVQIMGYHAHSVEEKTMGPLPSSRMTDIEERIGRIERHMSRVDGKLDAVLRHLNIDYDPYD